MITDKDGDPIHCGVKMWGIEYTYDHPQHFDGISEWWCESCDVRIGRWTEKVLNGGEAERRYGGRQGNRVAPHF